uniref:Uncharacterized protein n=1 Tax=Hyaloperonospora arabidopsidis (strain Emoy2) TaxID=559515 RepID=M4B5Q7_HYAAE
MSITVCAVWISVGRIDWMSLICKLDQSRQLDGFNSTDWKTTWRQVKPRADLDHVLGKFASWGSGVKFGDRADNSKAEVE